MSNKNIPVIPESVHRCILAALEDAGRRRHEYITLEHLLLAMLSEKRTREVLLACGARLEPLKLELETFSAPARTASYGRPIRAQADRWFPARAGAGHVARPGRRAIPAGKRRSARGAAGRTGFACALYPGAAGYHAPGRTEFYLARHQPRSARAAAGGRDRRWRRAGTGPACHVYHRAGRSGRGRQDRSADRPRGGA